MEKVSFSYTDEFGNENNMSKSFDSYGESQLECLVNEFKCFLLSMGYHPDTVNKVEIVE